MISNHFNADNGTPSGGGGGGEGSTIFSGHIVGDQMSSGVVPSLYSTSVQNNHSAAMAAAHMSATALLQKAAQMGSTSSNNNTASLLRTFGTSSSSTGGQNKPSDRPTVGPNTFGGTGGGLFGAENDQNNLQDLMNSFAAAGNSSIFGGNVFGGYEATNRGNLDHQDQKLQPNSSGGIPAMNNNMGGGSDRLTRDFLGVGQIIRSVSGGGFSKREQQQQQHRGIIEIGSLDSESNAAAPSSGQSFGGSAGNFQ